MVNDISDMYHSRAISVFHYVWHSSARHRHVHRLNKWLVVDVSYHRRGQPDDRRDHSVPRRVLDGRPRPKQRSTCQNYQKITTPHRRPKSDSAQRLKPEKTFDQPSVTSAPSLPVWPENVFTSWHLLSASILRKWMTPFASPTKHCRDNSSMAMDIPHEDKL